jgi:hypothetical protein
MESCQTAFCRPGVPGSNSVVQLSLLGQEALGHMHESGTEGLWKPSTHLHSPFLNQSQMLVTPHTTQDTPWLPLTLVTGAKRDHGCSLS